MTFSRDRASKHGLAAGPARLAGVFAYIVCDVCCAHHTPGHTCAKRFRSPSDLPFSPKGKQEPWNLLRDQTGGTPLLPPKESPWWSTSCDLRLPVLTLGF